MMGQDDIHVPRRPHGVLVVDDDADVREAIHDGLSREGFIVWLAAHGRGALDLFRRQRECIDVVLLDVCMPELDGPRTLMALQEVTPDIRCCFITGYLDSYTEQGLRRLGADAVFQKPFRLAEVSAALRSIVRQARTSLPA